jgi:hypothetical protein
LNHKVIKKILKLGATVLKKAKVWHSGLSKTGKVLVWSISAVMVGAVINGASANPGEPQLSEQTKNTEQTQQESVTEKKTVTETEAIAFSKTTVEDGAMDRGKSAVRVKGANGVKTLTYEVTYVDGQETDRVLIKDEITKQPINEVVAIGTYVAPPPPRPAPRASSTCDPNYSGCVPIASDVDCAGGSGNGPAYVNGPVRVVGVDIYDLDRDGNGFACE